MTKKNEVSPVKDIQIPVVQPDQLYIWEVTSISDVRRVKILKFEIIKGLSKS